MNFKMSEIEIMNKVIKRIENSYIERQDEDAVEGFTGHNRRRFQLGDGVVLLLCHSSEFLYNHLTLYIDREFILRFDQEKTNKIIEILERMRSWDEAKSKLLEKL